MMDVEMSAKGAHQMIMPLKEDIWDLNDAFANINNQAERIQVEDISWYCSHISQLEKPNNPANKSLWQLLNHFVRWVEDLEDEVARLKTGLVRSGERIGVLEMLLAMICTWVQVLEDVMEIDPPLIDLSLGDSEYADVNDGGIMLVEDLEDKKEQENIPPPVLHQDTPHPAPVFHSLIPIKDPVPVAPAVEVVDVDADGENDA
jgi:hypothetical protein